MKTRCFRLRKETAAVRLGRGGAELVLIPEGELISHTEGADPQLRLISDDMNRFVEIEWRHNPMLMFAVDFSDRSEAVYDGEQLVFQS